MKLKVGKLAANKSSANQILNLAIDGLSLLAAHEHQALSNLWAAAKVQARVAAKARTAAELLRDQIDLLPASRAHVLSDQKLRMALIGGLSRDLRSAAALRQRA